MSKGFLLKFIYFATMSATTAVRNVLIVLSCFFFIYLWYVGPINTDTISLALNVTTLTESNVKRQNTIVFHTAFYYNISTFYNMNTMVILFLADKDLEQTHLWNCNSYKNGTKNVTSPVKIKPSVGLHDICRWTVFLGECTVSVHPNAVSLSTANDTQSIPLAYELPDRKPRGIVACFAPMFFEERWHTIALTHELFAHWGIDLQVHYVQSAATQILTLLQPLVSKNRLEVRGIDLPDFGPEFEKKLGYKTFERSDWRQQVLAIEDCYFRYRESAEFIIIGDADDVFVPTKGENLYDEFKYWQTQAPTAASFEYPRQFAYGKVGSSIESYSVAESINSIRVTTKLTDAKSVYQTKITETPWIHWVALARSAPLKIPANESLVMHLDFTFDQDKKLPLGIPLTQYADVSALLETNGTIINFKHAAKTLKKLPTGPTVYASEIKKCYNEFYTVLKGEQQKKPFCPTPTICKIPKRSVPCSVAFRSYETSCISDNELCIVIPSGPLANFVDRKDGCLWGNF